MGTNIQGEAKPLPDDDRMKFSDWVSYHRKWVIVGGVVLCILLLVLLFSYRSGKLDQYAEKNREYSKAIKLAVKSMVAPKLGQQKESVYYELEFDDPIFPLRNPRRLEFECDTFRVTSRGAVVRGAKTLGFLDLKNSRFKLRSVIGDAWTKHSGPYELEVCITPYSEKATQKLVTIVEGIPPGFLDELHRFFGAVQKKQNENVTTSPPTQQKKRNIDFQFGSTGEDKGWYEDAEKIMLMRGSSSQRAEAWYKGGKTSVKFMKRLDRNTFQVVTLTLRQVQIESRVLRATFDIDNTPGLSVELRTGKVEGTVQDVFDD